MPDQTKKSTKFMKIIVGVFMAITIAIGIISGVSGIGVKQSTERTSSTVSEQSPF